MNGYTSRLVDNDQSIVLMDDAYGLCSDWRFVSMEGVANDIAVLDGGGGRWHRFTIDMDGAAFYRTFLEVSVRSLSSGPWHPFHLHSTQPAGLETRL